ncbi:MAG TPA: cellulase N-terminal Ig-like domain-containing protein, partial [Tepidisphaeraceae bacterium]|nr:cellulase N-terminal Ig-like domain-containing protein [Tepidisphaeraceae bacterium]
MSKPLASLSILLAVAGSGICLSTSHAASEGPTMPMSIDTTRAANTRWLNKPVLESRMLDSMEMPDTWTHAGPGQMSFTAQRAVDGKQSIRLVTRTVTDRPNVREGRPHGEATLRRVVNGEDWSTFNRLSIWVYPEMPGFKVGSVVLKFNNDGKEKIPGMWTHGPMHYALVKPGQWNHIVWEISHLSRDKVTGIDLIYRLQGNEPGATETVTLDWDKFELQRVEGDYIEGWAVAPQRIAFSHSGYEAGGPKTAIANVNSWTPTRDRSDFELVDQAANRVVLRKPLRTVKSDLGEFQVLDFSEQKTPGEYVLRIGDVV